MYQPVYYTQNVQEDDLVTSDRTKGPTITLIVGPFGAGYGIRTRGINFGKVACYRYIKPAYSLLTLSIIANTAEKVKHFFPNFCPL